VGVRNSENVCLKTLRRGRLGDLCVIWRKIKVDHGTGF